MSSEMKINRTMGSVRIMQRIQLVALFILADLCAGAARNLSEKYHRERRQKQHEELQRRIKLGINNGLPPIHVLDDLPPETLSNHQFSSGNIGGFGQHGYNKLRVGDEAQPLVPGDTQLVYVSFITEGDFFVDAVNANDPSVVTQIGPFPLYDYSEAEQAQIISRMQADYVDYPVEFVLFEPTTGPYATVEINSNTFLEVSVDDDGNVLAYTAVLFGEAQFIDFLNQVAEDSATVDANFWNLLILLGDEDLFYGIAGLDPATVPVPEALSQVMVTSTSNTASHELGHLLGLRHIDSVGAPGDGIPDPNTGDNIPLNFFPEYPGPFEALETFNHLIASGASVGLTFEIAARVDRFFSERSALKLALAFASDPPTRTEQDFVDAPDVAFELSDIIIPNTVESGVNQGSGPLVVQTTLVSGRISVEGESDQYSFLLEGNRFVTAEIVSVVDATQFDDVITRIQLYRQLSDGSFALVRENSQEIESFDPVMLDVPIDSEGVYQFRIDAPRTIFVDESGELPGSNPVDISTIESGEDFLTGDYQLLIYSYESPLQILSPTTSPGQQNQPTQAPAVRPPTQAPIRAPTLTPKTPPTPYPVRTLPPKPVFPPAKGKGKGGHGDPFVWYDSGKGTMMMKNAFKQKYNYRSHNSSKKMKSSMKKSSKKGKKSSKKGKKSSKKGKFSYPVYYKGATPTYYKGKGFKGGTPYYGKTSGTFFTTMDKSMMSKKHSMYGSGVYPNSAGARGSPFNYNKPKKQELPSSYFFYRGDGKGNRGIDVFVFGRPN